MKRISSLFVGLVVLFCVALVVSNIIAGKLYQAPWGIVLTSAVWLFPIVYIIGDVVPEVYGLATARKMIWFGFAANAFAVAFFWLTLRLPAPGFWQGQAAFETVLGFTPRLLLASFVGYLVGTNANAWTLVLIKKWTGGRWLWMRTIGSTLVGETLDSILFVGIAFYGGVPLSALPGMILAQTVFKSGYEALATPLTYAVVNWVKKHEQSLGETA
jgi:uncharacterized integral membrane protein (TIGR00697 family)